jgi:GH24 family phage-related lysozyme (muramidase)
MASYLDQSLAKLKKFEGSVPWMYRDTRGNVTVGVGLMLPYPAAACTLPFFTAGRPASSQEIAADYARVEGLPAGHIAAFYRLDSGLELSPTEIDSLLLNTLSEFEQAIRARLPGFDALPDPVKLALLDMAYNLGVGGLFHGYPRMIEAVEAGAWAQAAAQCLRHGIGDARNAWTKAQFLSAGIVGSIQAVANRPLVHRLIYGLIGWIASLLGR